MQQQQLPLGRGIVIPEEVNSTQSNSNTAALVAVKITVSGLLDWSVCDQLCTLAATVVVTKSHNI